jgi:cytochrome oxidase assembly protein ShyY1
MFKDITIRISSEALSATLWFTIGVASTIIAIYAANARAEAKVRNSQASNDTDLDWLN